MTQREELLAGLTPPLRKLYRAIEQHGPLAAPALRVDLPLNGDGDWKGRGDGMTVEFRKLQATGLIRQVGTDGSKPGPPARIYGVTPEGEVEKEAKKFASKQPGRRKRDMSGDSARIAECRRREKELGPTARGDWMKSRRRVLELGKVFRDLDEQVYWSEKSVPDVELEMVYDELVKIVAHGIRLEAAVDRQRSNKEMREKIAALRAKANSTEFPGEAEVFRQAAARLEAGLDTGA